MGAGVLFGARFVCAPRIGGSVRVLPSKHSALRTGQRGDRDVGVVVCSQHERLAVERKVCAASASTCACGKRCANSARLGASRVDGRPAASAHKMGVSSAASERLLTTDDEKVLRLATKLAAWRIDAVKDSQYLRSAGVFSFTFPQFGDITRPEKLGLPRISHGSRVESRLEPSSSPSVPPSAAAICPVLDRAAESCFVAKAPTKTPPWVGILVHSDPSLRPAVFQSAAFGGGVTFS